MNIRAALLKEYSKAQCQLIVNHIGDDPHRFAELMKLFFSAEEKITQRAGWIMTHCLSAHPLLVKPYFKKLIDFIKRKDVHSSVERNIMRSLEDVEIPEKWEGVIMDISFNYIADPQAAIAVKAFSLGVLGKLLKKYPEILPEIKVIIEERWSTETPAFKSRAKKFLKK